MAHRHRRRARYVQNELESRVGEPVAYTWCLKQVQKHLLAAQEKAARTGKMANDIIVDLAYADHLARAKRNVLVDQ